MPLEFHSLKVATVRPSTDAAIQIGFKIPAKKTEIFKFNPGQYLTLSLTIEDKRERRAYSICSATHDKYICVLVKRVSGGLVSNYLNDHIKVGDQIDVLPANGHFQLSLDETIGHHYYFFGGGSGITPLMSMISSILEHEPLSRCYLLYGNRDEDNVIFYDRFKRLKLVYKSRLFLQFMLSQPRGDSNFKDYIPGRIDQNSIARFINAHGLTKNEVDGYFICGPGPMIEATHTALLELDVDKKEIHQEYFSAPLSDEVDIVADIERSKIKSTVKVKLEGEEITLIMDGHTNIVQALLDNDYEPPYSCLSGTCSTCMAKLEKGNIEMNVSIGLEDDEKENGYILSCQAHPTTDSVMINYDNI